MNKPENHSAKINSDEFMPGVTDEFNLKEMSGMSRRRFLALAGASTAFAVTACTNYRDKGEIMPYVKKPEDVTIGKANYYATTCNECPVACGALVKTREGRPIKLMGNPENPVSAGKICAMGEATVLNLYDPDRIRFPLNLKGSDLFLFKNDVVKESWQNIDKEVVEALNKAKNEGKEIAILSHTVNSPSVAKLFGDFKAKYPNTKVYSYEVFDNQNRLSAWKKSFGCSCIPVIKWSDAKTILALDADIIGNEGNFLEQINQITSKRNPDEPKSYCRIYSAESVLTLTGMNADYRIRIKPAKQYEFVMALLNELIFNRKISQFRPDVSLENEIKKYNLSSFTAENNIDKKVTDHLISDFVKTKGKALVYAGDKLDEQTHIAVNMLNEALEAGNLYSDVQSTEILPLSSDEEIKQLIGSMNSGRVALLINYGTNPVYHFPQSSGFEKAMKNVAKVITMTESRNETSILSKITLPVNHMLESWGDFQTRTGFISLQQPVIAPIFSTRQKEAILLNWLGDKPENYNETIYHKYLMNRWQNDVFPKAQSSLEFQAFWYDALMQGGSSVTDAPPCSCKFSFKGNLTKPESRDFDMVICKSHFLSDGKFANNGWLQEIPHPVTKVTWDNYASISPDTAKNLNLKMDDRVSVSYNGMTTELPLMIQPGMADGVIAVELGYGRWAVGDVGKKVGVYLNNFLAGGDNKYIKRGASISKAPGKYVLAATQEHHAITEEKVKDFHLKRKIIIEGTLDEYKKDPAFLKKESEGEIVSITPAVQYPGVKWAMSIDLNKCTGCSMCVASCNVENNVPVVGREQVLKGREMHWMRIDRYYAGDNNSPDVSVQPVLCSHCDNAPCENVCPVVATNHSPDGLNQMAYNRCVGTRYCANNCPFKVRRFNFFNFRSDFRDGYYEQDTLRLLHNPEVTVRSRGVMEKCTFCIQRIMEARQNAIKDGKQLKGEDVQTACQIACPASAITFGDSNDKNSDISKKRAHNLNYYLMPELNIKPNVSYLAKLKNKYTEEA